jgi:cadherin-like protein
METVLSALVVIFLVLYGALNLSHASLSSQAMMETSWQEMQTRLDTQARSSLTAIRARIVDNGTDVEFSVRNTGTAKLADFQRWDAIVQYNDANSASHIVWLGYKVNAPERGQWTVAGIYLDSEKQTAEAFEPGVLDPGEEATFQLKISPPVAPGMTLEALISNEMGVGASTFVTRNVPPVLATNNVLTVTVGSTGVIGSNVLSVTDVDNTPDQLTYTITTAPAQGALNLPVSFTQADIDASNLSYTQTGSGPDSLQFTVSDGEDVIGPYTFNIAVNQSPTLAVNAGLTTTVGNAVNIGTAMLQTTDLDNLSTELTYNIVAAPMQGTLSLTTTFTQQQIDDGLLIYNPFSGAAGADSFEFTVSDGLATVGPYLFNITVAAS